MFKRTKISTCALLALGGVLLVPASAVAQQAAQRIEITGSAIKRINAEGAAPVEIYTKKDIDRTGATTIAELVKSIASLDIDDQGELTGNSPSGSGTTNLQIRGLSERNLLVLLNGRRMPVNALHDGSGAGAAVDINRIPLSAIDRVEILKDGGSAIYGADAVAGVINFITRKNFTGLEMRMGYGVSSRGDSKETPLGVVAGFGDYDASGFNVFAALDYFKRDALPRTERELTRTADWRRFDGGLSRSDGRSTFHPSGNIVAGPGAPGQVAPCPADDLPLVGDLCRFDFNKTILTSINGADRWSAMVLGSVKLGANMRGYGQFVRSESKDLFEAQPAPGAVPDFQGTGNTVRARFMQPGPRTTNRKASLDHVVAGVEGTFGNIDFDFAVGQGTSKVSNNDKNYVATDLFFAAITSGTIDPTILTNPTAVVDAIRLTPNRTGKSINRFIDGKISGPLMDLAGGPLAYAVGFQVAKESLVDRPDADQQAGNVFGSIAQAAVDAKRDQSAVFAELSIPFAKGVEAQVAVRYDKYPDYKQTSPKVALKWQPTSNFAVRGSYAESFLAPSLKQLFGGQDEGAESTSDPDICAFFPTLAGSCSNFPYKEVSGSNPNLKPETGKTYNVGLVFEPSPVLGVSLDLWRIEKKDEIGTLSTESALANGAFGIRNGEAEVFVNNQNIAATKVEGVDIDTRLRLGQTMFGKVTVRNATTYYKSVQTQFEPGDVFYEYVGTFLIPRWRNNLAVNFETGPWSSTVSLRTTGGMKDSTQPLQLTPSTNRRIKAHEELDLVVQYAGVKNLELTGTVRNLLDNMPPFSQRGTLNQYGSLGFPWIYSPRGRFFAFSANYKFY